MHICYLVVRRELVGAIDRYIHIPYEMGSQETTRNSELHDRRTGCDVLFRETLINDYLYK